MFIFFLKFSPTQRPLVILRSGATAVARRRAREQSGAGGLSIVSRLGLAWGWAQVGPHAGGRGATRVRTRALR